MVLQCQECSWPTLGPEPALIQSGQALDEHIVQGHLLIGQMAPDDSVKSQVEQ